MNTPAHIDFTGDPMAWVHGRRVTVLGAARSGLAAAELLRRHGIETFVSDAGSIDAGNRERLEEIGAAFEAGGHTVRALEADLMVASPGVPDTAEPMVRAAAADIPIISEIELASWFCTAPITAVTGSNGKTTTTELLGHLFRRDGRRTAVCGNVGRPFSSLADAEPPYEMVVLEVSSFQLDHVHTFRPDIAVILNITPDHMDRYGGSLASYALAKWAVTGRQTADDALILNMDDPILRTLAGLETGAGRSSAPRSSAGRTGAAAEPGPLPDLSDARPTNAQLYGITIENRPGAAGCLDGDRLILDMQNKRETLMKLEHLALRGRHNVYNSLAAAVAARVAEVRSDIVRESLESFEGVPHRLETVRETDGVRWVNDSKATNVNAVWYALESFSGPIVLIMGGRDKGNSYESLKPLVSSRVKALISIGESAEVVDRELGPLVKDHVIADGMGDAVRLAALLARSGDVVLLSPACSSFDMFTGFEERGETFRRLVNEL